MSSDDDDLRAESAESAGARCSNGVTELWLCLCGVSPSEARRLRIQNPDPFDYQDAAQARVPPPETTKHADAPRDRRPRRSARAQR